MLLIQLNRIDDIALVNFKDFETFFLNTEIIRDTRFSGKREKKLCVLK